MNQHIKVVRLSPFQSRKLVHLFKPHMQPCSVNAVRTPRLSFAFKVPMLTLLREITPQVGEAKPILLAK